MERTKRTKMIPKSFKISEYDWELLVKTAKKSGQTRSNLIRSAILEKIFRINGGK